MTAKWWEGKSAGRAREFGGCAAVISGARRASWSWLEDISCEPLHRACRRHTGCSRDTPLHLSANHCLRIVYYECARPRIDTAGLAGEIRQPRRLLGVTFVILSAIKRLWMRRWTVFVRCAWSSGDVKIHNIIAAHREVMSQQNAGEFTLKADILGSLWAALSCKYSSLVQPLRVVEAFPLSRLWRIFKVNSYNSPEIPGFMGFIFRTRFIFRGWKQTVLFKELRYL